MLRWVLFLSECAIDLTEFFQVSYFLCQEYLLSKK